MSDQPEAFNNRIQNERDAVDLLRQQREFLRQVLDINPNLIFAKDREGRFTLVNKTIADIYGTTIDELIGKTDADFNPNADEVAFFRRIDLEVMDSLKEIVIPEELITDAQGNKHWLQTVKRPIVGPDGTADQVLGVATDITVRKNLEDQLRHSQKMDALGQLAGGIAHDFNNMLMVILANAERLLQRISKDRRRDEELATGLELIISSAERTAMLVSQLLAFGRKQSVSPVVLDLGRIVTDMTVLLRRIVGENIHLALNTKSTKGIRADPVQIEQIVINLALNARDAMKHGGTLTISTSEVSVDAARAAKNPEAVAGRFVCLTVADTGEGMSSEVASRAFEPFFTTKPMGKGTGLGLSTVYGIVKQLGGFITLETSPGRGARFDAHLPSLDAPVTEVVLSGDLGELRGTETVLVCEDEEDVLQLVCAILEDNGYTVLSASSGEQAILRSAGYAGPIELLLTDVVMPQMNGPRLAESIRATRPTIQTLYMTGYSAESFGAGQLHGEVHELIHKPFSAASLLRHVRCILDAAAD